jgi:1-acyl-sn-glycerol-3-phosphate acyltransferase
MMIEKIIYWLSYAIFGIYIRFMMNPDIEWQEKLPQGPTIIAPNHPSTSDPFIVAMMARRPLNILIIEHIFKIPFVGAYLRRSGHIPVIPTQGRMAFERARQLLDQGRTVVIFPEGVISPQDGTCAPPRTGVARLAALTGAAVVPVGIHLDSSRIHSVEEHIDGETHLASWYFKGPYRITVGSPMKFQCTLEDRQRISEISHIIMNRIVHLAQQSKERAGIWKGTLQPVLD